MPRKLVTPRLLELTHSDAPGWLISARRSPPPAMGSQPRPITIIAPPTPYNGDSMTSSAARCLLAMIGDAADFADGLD